MIHVTRAEHRSGYRVWCRFSDGTSGEADLADMLWGEAFEPLRDPKRFAELSVSDTFGTIVWPNGADIAPEALYERVTGRRANASQAMAVHEPPSPRYACGDKGKADPSA